MITSIGSRAFFLTLCFLASISAGIGQVNKLQMEQKSRMSTPTVTKHSAGKPRSSVSTLSTSSVHRSQSEMRAAAESGHTVHSPHAQGQGAFAGRSPSPQGYGTGAPSGTGGNFNFNHGMAVQPPGQRPMPGAGQMGPSPGALAAHRNGSGSPNPAGARPAPTSSLANKPNAGIQAEHNGTTPAWMLGGASARTQRKPNTNSGTNPRQR